MIVTAAACVFSLFYTSVVLIRNLIFLCGRPSKRGGNWIGGDEVCAGGNIPSPLYFWDQGRLG